MARLRAGVVFSVNLAPRPIVVYDQPPCPGDDYVWTPGYYQHGDHGYFWVAGQWVLPPNPGVLWTPGYWAFERGHYGWHEGYWGREVGFYGGVNYGNGYFGTGFNGGRWEGDVFRHNTVITNVDREHVRNVYEDRTVVRDVRGPNHSFNGGHGINVQPTPQERRVAEAPHQGPTPAQVSRFQESHDGHMAAHGAPRGGERH